MSSVLRQCRLLLTYKLVSNRNECLKFKFDKKSLRCIYCNKYDGELSIIYYSKEYILI